MVLFCVFITCVQDLLLSIVLSSKNAVAIVGMNLTVASIQISFESSSKTCTEKLRKDLRIIEPSAFLEGCWEKIIKPLHHCTSAIEYSFLGLGLVRAGL